MQVNMLEAKSRLSELVRAVQAGEEVVIANRGKPVVRLVSAQEPPLPTARVGSAAALLEHLKRNPLPLDPAYRRGDRRGDRRGT
jgi:prevent-host-death family protein